jgi:hypothetical protein
MLLSDAEKPEVGISPLRGNNPPIAGMMVCGEKHRNFFGTAALEALHAYEKAIASIPDALTLE